ncbi:MerR family transcriptional regulator [[Mycobacterium] wendilense]|uniref:MerR family transcriptional regulator n=1 Tax=[Mycobacterium] wendilense TaxID=3064284 RepID=A0ABM9MI55_9MYCO|nr:MerR family transcriptional regulator [Mycolicibacterium sp. MU0050]CAJ1585774.1 MerR family transcriptional regulator [Mycolicibacterium sp. MU0050]
MADDLTIDEFARITNTSARNVRAYHERRLLPPPRMVGRTGYYQEMHIERMAAIQALQAEGFSLAAVRALLDAWESGTTIDELVGAKHTRAATRSGAIDLSAVYPMTKFRFPGLHPDHIVRNRLLGTLAGDGVPHTQLIAPGGSGKSTLAAEYVRTLPGDCAWVSLDSDDDDAGRFWTTVLIGIRTVRTDFGPDLLSRLVGGANVDAVLIDIADELSTSAHSLTVVLDDLHVIGSDEVMRQLHWFITRVHPSHCRLLICSRTRPSIAAARLVIGGHLAVLDTEDLAFDPDETRELLVNRLKVDLTAAQVAEIVERTDGWPAGIYLAGMALRNGASPESVLQALIQPDRRTHEYFSEEVLTLLEPAHLRFLEEISILERFNAELCDHVRRAWDSQQFLDELEDNLFIIPLDDTGYWKRLHHTFASVVRARATLTEHRMHRHQRAAHWYRQHDQLPEAVHHLIEAGEFDAAARLIGDIYPAFLNVSNQGAMVERWLDKLPPELIANSTTLSLATALIAGLRGDTADMSAWLANAEKLSAHPTSSAKSSATTLSLVYFVRGLLHFGAVEQAREWARTGYQLCPPEHVWMPMQAASLALLCTWVDGPTEEVLTLCEQVLSCPAGAQQPIATTGAWALKAVVLASQGDPPGALAAVRRAGQIRATAGLNRVPQSANTWTSSARAHRLLGMYDAAAADAENGYAAISNGAPGRDGTGAVVPLLIELVHARRHQGRGAEARRFAEEARARLRDVDGTGLLPQMLAEATAGL